RLVEDAGGRRFVKGFTGKDMEIWRSAFEGLAACGADIESGEARLEEDVGRFEQEISRVNADIAAQKVSSAPWDNATKETQALERKEDADAARDERRTAMGATLPPGMLENPSGTCAVGGVESQGPSGGSSQRRPVLLLLGLDLPASVRDEVRAGLERDAPDLFGQHVVGVDALPSLASAAQAAGGQGCFLEPCREQTAGAVSPPPSTQPTRETVVTGNTGQRGSPNHGERLGGVATARGDFEQGVVARTRANLVQAALSAGKNVSLEVVPGPGLWARGRFLRDLEALLGGLDACGCGVDDSDTDTKQSGPTVLLVEGHSRNRAGGGMDVSHGTKFVDTLALRGEGAAKNWEADCSYDQGPEGTLPPALLTARRLKALMEEATQCLHDLSTEYGRTPSPFKAIQDDSYASKSSKAPRETHQRRQGTIRAEGSTDPERPTAGSFQMGKQCNASLAATGSRGMALLLAACHMLLHPGRRYDLGEFRTERGRDVDLTEGMTMQKSPGKAPPTSSEEVEHGAFEMVHASDLARSCREELANQGSARGVAALLRRADLYSMPLETAVALQRLVQHSDWPVASPRSDFAGCSASGAFVGWVVAAVAVTTELVLGGGGVALGAGSGSARNPSGDVRKAVASGAGVEGRDWCGGAGGAGSTAEGSGGDALLSTSMRNVQEERTREQRLLLGMETSLIDENVVVLDDDSPWLPPPEGPEGHGDVRNRRQCRASEVFNALLDTVLRPFNVFEVVDHEISLGHSRPQQQETAVAPSVPQARGEGPLSKQMGVCRGGSDRFCVTVSRAFGSIYARAVVLGTGSMRKGQAVTARTKDEDLIPLLSSNWMEKHDLSALRELRTEPAVWRALVDTLVLYFPNHETFGPTGDGTRAVKLCFRHERRLTLETSCLLMGRVVPVAVFEESRSDFWCEGVVPAALSSLGSSGCPVVTGMRVPKECIPLILDSNHPMRMQTILNASDLRELSGLIADRLKLSRVGSSQREQRSCHSWLDGAIRGENRPGNSEDPSGTATDLPNAARRDKVQSRAEFKLSLRKRSVGQVIFSRLVSFWVPAVDKGDVDNVGRDVSDVGNMDGRQKEDRLLVIPSTSSGHAVQRLVVVKEYAHRGACGELRGEVYDPGAGGAAEIFVLTPELARILLGDWRAELENGDRTKNISTCYWSYALTWRLRLGFNAEANEKTGDGSGSIVNTMRTSRSHYTNREDPLPHLTVDERKPLFSLRRIGASWEVWPADGGGDDSLEKRMAYFDMLILATQPETGGHMKMRAHRRTTSIEFVATHCQTMAVFRFRVPVRAFVKEFDALLAACLTAPTALSSELNLSVPNDGLRNMAGKWLHYSPGDAKIGCRPTLALSFPGTKVVTAKSYVSLRGARHQPATCRDSHSDSASRRLDRHERGTDGTDIAGRQENPSLQGRVCHSGEERQPESGGRHGSRGWNARGKISTLRVETRNERMIFRRRLAVPRSEDVYLGRENPSFAGQRQEGGTREKGVGEVLPMVLAVSVYESFTAGSTGRIERYLKFCARDETVRPTMETITTIPWVGTCEGIEGGRMWRVVTQGLRCGCTRDEMGNRVGIRLVVSTEEILGKTDIYNSVEDQHQRHSQPLAPKRSSEEASNVDERSETKMAAVGGTLNTHNNDMPAVSGPARTCDRQLGQGPSTTMRGQTNPATVVDTNGQQDDCYTSTDCPRSTLPDLLGKESGISQRYGEFGMDRTTKLYTGWHDITGVRLHVQCFQEGGCNRQELHGNPGNAGGIELTESGWQPTGRGGAIDLPRAASLRFVVWDPSSGYRTGLQVSVNDVYRNLSVDGGIVEAGLLDAGRRPALARAIAQKLRLVFQEGGGYEVVLPLPASWNRASPRVG
ncbi:unnamed protein product, partial [Ectocarpus sp. 8 AP-2014]